MKKAKENNVEKPIKTSNLTTSYGKSRGITGINLEVKKGEIFGFIGPNGAGKSTTIRTMLGFLFPSEGNVSVLDMDVAQDIVNIKNKIGYLPSEVNYYDEMTVKEVLDYSAKFYKKDCKARIDELVKIFDMDVTKKINKLSLGNKKKVAIVQALLHEPELLILDEPTNGLDPLMQSRFFEVLKKENEKGTTIFFSSHVLSEVQKVCDRVAIIKEGKIIKVETIENIINMTHLHVKIYAEDLNVLAEELADKLKVTFEEKEENLEFYYNDDVNKLLQIISNYKIQNIQITEPSLEETFGHYYE